jgi:hypothetical protein
VALDWLAAGPTEAGRAAGTTDAAADGDDPAALR